MKYGADNKVRQSDLAAEVFECPAPDFCGRPVVRRVAMAGDACHRGWSGWSPWLVRLVIMAAQADHRG